VNAVAATDINHRPATRQRGIGTIATAARIIVGALLLGSVVQGHLARGFHLSSWALGLLGFPAVLLAWQWLRARRTPTRRVRPAAG
jgi:urea transporter